LAAELSPTLGEQVKANAAFVRPLGDARVVQSSLNSRVISIKVEEKQGKIAETSPYSMELKWKIVKQEGLPSDFQPFPMRIFSFKRNPC
jgi:hypothetical protein